MRRRGRQPAPPRERRPHPNPRTEIQLQQILSLRRAAERNEELLDRLHGNLAEVSDKVSRHPTWDGHGRRLDEIDRLNGEIARLGAENKVLHERIAELSAPVDDTDLAFLEAED